MSAHLLQQPNKRRVSTKLKSLAKSKKSLDSDPIVGRTMWDVVSAMANAVKRPIVAIPLSLGIAGGITLLTISGVLRVAYGKEGLTVNMGAPFGSTALDVERAATTGLEKRIADGRALQRPYILDDVTVLIRMTDVANGSLQERHVDWRIIYTVRALQPILKTDKLFKERYSTASATIKRWVGSEVEVKATDDAYNVMMDIPVGETRTIVTGATFVYSLPLQDNRRAFGQNILLTPNQEFFSYPNEEDVIGELTFVIESDTLKLNPVEQAAKRSGPDGSVAPDVDYRFSNQGDRKTLSAHWKDIMPKEEVGLHFKIE